MTWHTLATFVVDQVLGFQTANKFKDNFDHLAAAGVATSYITNLAVTEGKIGSGAVTEAKIGSGAVTEAKIGAASVSQGKLETSTGTSSGTFPAYPSVVTITMQDYCFFPRLSSGSGVQIIGQPYATSGTVGSFSFESETSSGGSYCANWRYVTATDEPFVYAIQDKKTGEIEHVWACGDPPPGYWGIDEKPDDFEPPIKSSNGRTGKNEITIFKYGMDEFKEIIDRSEKDKKEPHQMLNDDFEYKEDRKLFVTKNLREV